MTTSHPNFTGPTERWRNCPNTHCERAQECRSPHECSGTGKRLWDRAQKRPAGSNADEWHLFLSEYCDARAATPNALTYVAVQIAEAIEAVRSPVTICGACGHPWQENMSCGQKDNGHPFLTCYPAVVPSA